MRIATLLPALLVLARPAAAANPPEWSAPHAAHRIAGNVFYVGTADLGVYLVRGSAGDILVNTGLAESADLIVAGIRSVGADPRNVRILLTNQAHFDHVGALAEMKKRTGAKVYAAAGDAKILEDGGASDPGGLSRFEPVTVDRVLKDGDLVTLGDVTLRVVSTPGHTPGSVSYETTVRDGAVERTLLLANLPTVVMPLKNPNYPGIVADLRAAFARLEALRPDIWVAAHASQCRLDEKIAAGSFVDPAGYAAAVARCKADFEGKAKAEGVALPAVPRL